MTAGTLSQRASPDGAGADAGGATRRRRIVVSGVVQGVGFRPFVVRLAADLQLSGHCGNDAVSVFIEAEGSAWALDELERRVRADAPPLALIVGMRSESMSPRGDSSFSIVGSKTVPGARTLVSPDVATCDDCLQEMTDPGNRRYRHPFITCTNCGPRFTIITDLPYDRPSTTMADFAMCDRCQAEYREPTDRRYHAQPISCHDCGPRVWAEEAGERVADTDDAVFAVVQGALADGKIVAIKGIGGFHLACDATSDAVTRLRDRKQRPAKPFAVMAPDLEAARRIAVVSDAEAATLQQPARPIVVLRKRENLRTRLADGVAPDLDEVGIMLPYAPVHDLLFAPVPGQAVSPPTLLVMTSGNLSDEPLCFTNTEARQRLSGIADIFLMSDRDIAVPCEDSVLTVLGETELPIRRSRGFAPLPVPVAEDGPPTLAVGAEVKNTFCLTRGGFAFCSAHLGDMGSLESQQAFETSIEQFMSLHGTRPELLVADDHPGYATRQWAQRCHEESGIAFTTVQHHHAHLASLLAEHDLLGTPVLGVAFDGTGYGCDRSIWGGELLYLGSQFTHAERVGHLQPFPLPGGDAAIRNPFRVALGLLHLAGEDDPAGLDLAGLDLMGATTAAERAAVNSQIVSGIGCVDTTSAGRLFDGVASLLGVRHRVSYEAQAAIELEVLARTTDVAADLPMGHDHNQVALGPLIHALVAGIRTGTLIAELALGFHHALARATAELTIALAHERRVDLVGLTGGVFQNRILLAEFARMLRAAGLRVLTHQRVPPNDGGLSLGQAVVGRAKVAGRKDQAAAEPAGSAVIGGNQ